MSSAKTLGVRHPRGFPDTAESDYIPSETSRLSESSQDLIHACEVFFETDVMALYGCPELIHYEVTVPEHTLPFSVLVSTRSEITKSEPDPRHNSHEIELAYAERIGQLEHEGLAEGIELNEIPRKTSGDSSIHSTLPAKPNWSLSERETCVRSGKMK